MSPWIWTAFSVVYVIGAAVSFRFIYLKEVEKVYQERLDRRRCDNCAKKREYWQDYVQRDPSYSRCDYHKRMLGRPVAWSMVLFVTLLWPVILFVIGWSRILKAVGWVAKKTIFPTGISTPSKVEWEAEEAAETRATELKKLQEDAEKLGLPFPSGEKKEITASEPRRRRGDPPTYTWEYVVGTEEDTSQVVNEKAMQRIEKRVSELTKRTNW